MIIEKFLIIKTNVIFLAPDINKVHKNVSNFILISLYIIARVRFTGVYDALENTEFSSIFAVALINQKPKAGDIMDALLSELMSKLCSKQLVHCVKLTWYVYTGCGITYEIRNTCAENWSRRDIWPAPVEQIFVSMFAVVSFLCVRSENSNQYGGLLKMFASF